VKASEIARLLPGVFRRTLRPGGPLAALLEVMEAMHAPAEEALERWDATLDPLRTRDDFVPFLARWVDLGRLFESEGEAAGPSAARYDLAAAVLGRLRELVAAAAGLARRQGTAGGLIRFLETATGVAGFAVEEQVPGPDGLPLPFHVRVRAPAAAAARRALVERIIELEKPAHVTHELVFDKPNA
jgi:phage tail-like protein